MAYREQHLPVIIWNPDHKEISIRGETIKLADIPKAYNDVMDRAKFLFESMTQGIDTSLTFPYSSLVDDLNESTPGYSFLKTPILEQYRFKLFSHLVQDPKYALRVVGENVVWNKVSTGEWMEMAQELNACLLFLIHLGSGQPARGTEVLSILFRNMQNVHRSLFAIPGGLATILGYNKVCATIVSLPTSTNMLL